MPARVHIVEASTPEQLDAVRRLFEEYAESLGWDTGQSWMAEEIARLPGPYAPPRGSLLLAYVDDLPAGAVGLQPVPEESRVPGLGAERFGEAKRLFVRPEERRHGVGRALMERLHEEARRRAYEAVVLTTSVEMMPLAQGLYDALGYVPTEPYRDDMPYPGIRWLRLDLPR
jgi:putative acetyltransferase